jgi:hypothetical protein
VSNPRLCLLRWSAAVCGVASASLGSIAFGGVHPKLLLTGDDMPRLRHVCGVSAGGADSGELGRAGAHAPEFQALRSHFGKRLGDDLLPGEVSAAAFLHLIDPGDPLDARRLKLIEATLRDPSASLASTLEMVIALDWCWPDLPTDVRRDFLANLTRSAGVLTAADSPLDHRGFHEKLSALAAAAVIDEQDEASAAWGQTRRAILEAAREYFRGTFGTFLDWRGLAPTSPTAGPAEECDAALAVEIAGLALGQETWHDFGPRVGRWLEHYVYASFAHPGLQHAFIRDEGTDAPLSPAPSWDELEPLTAHLIATRTGDPAAGFIARRVDQRLRGAAAEPSALPWQWIPILFELSEVRRCDFSRLPLARNFGGAVAFRSASGARETGVWIEAGQPFLRRGQHFDAGHFLIHSGGHLAVSGGDDICLEAVPVKDGEQRLGRESRPFEFEQYLAATIAHNCLLLRSPLRVERWYGQAYQPAAGQRLIENSCTNFAAALEGNPRQTGRQLAYGQGPDVAYLALDLKPAYDPRLASAYTREFLFLDGRFLLVIDRVAAVAESDPTWVINIPGRPSADSADLAPARRTMGDDNEAGVWQLNEATWLRWTDGDGAAFMASLRPSPRRLWVVGGPAKSMTIPAGAYAGRTYRGGEPGGFENLVRPVSEQRPQNAWYRLGRPTVLGPAFGEQPHWGRIEIAPADKTDSSLFVTLFVIGSKEEQQPSVSTETTADELRIQFVGGRTTTVALRLDRAPGVVVVRPDAAEWSSPRAVESDAVLPQE